MSFAGPGLRKRSLQRVYNAPYVPGHSCNPRHNLETHGWARQAQIPGLVPLHLRCDLDYHLHG